MSNKLLMMTKDTGLIVAACVCGGHFEAIEYRQYETDAECTVCGIIISLVEITSEKDKYVQTQKQNKRW